MIAKNVITLVDDNVNSQALILDFLNHIPRDYEVYSIDGSQNLVENYDSTRAVYSAVANPSNVKDYINKMAMMRMIPNMHSRNWCFILREMPDNDLMEYLEECGALVVLCTTMPKIIPNDNRTILNVVGSPDTFLRIENNQWVIGPDEETPARTSKLLLIGDATSFSKAVQALLTPEPDSMFYLLNSTGSVLTLMTPIGNEVITDKDKIDEMLFDFLPNLNTSSSTTKRQVYLVVEDVTVVEDRHLNKLLTHAIDVLFVSRTLEGVAAKIALDVDAVIALNDYKDATVTRTFTDGWQVQTTLRLGE